MFCRTSFWYIYIYIYICIEQRWLGILPPTDGVIVWRIVQHHLCQIHDDQKFLSNRHAWSYYLVTWREENSLARSIYFHSWNSRCVDCQDRIRNDIWFNTWVHHWNRDWDNISIITAQFVLYYQLIPIPSSFYYYQYEYIILGLGYMDNIHSKYWAQNIKSGVTFQGKIFNRGSNKNNAEFWTSFPTSNKNLM